MDIFDRGDRQDRGLAWVLVVVVVGDGRGARVPSVDGRGARTPMVDGDGGVAVVEGDALAGADDEGELGEGCEGEELADGGEDRGVDNAGGRDDKACDYQASRNRQCHCKYHGMESCFHCLILVLYASSPSFRRF